MMHALAEGLPVTFGILLPERCYDEAWTTGIVPHPTEEERELAQRRPGHAMLAVGYDRREQMFLVRNSWGEEFGDRGYCSIPFEVMERCSRPESFWIIAELEKEEKTASLKVVRPSHQGAAQAPRPSTIRTEAGAGMAAQLRDQIRASLEADIKSASGRIDKWIYGKGPGGDSVECSECAGHGLCVNCLQKGASCGRCRNTGFCTTCKGLGTV
jgi:hypothetical protein